MRYTSKNVDLKTILSDYFSVVPPQSTEGVGSSTPDNERKLRAVRAPGA